MPSRAADLPVPAHGQRREAIVQALLADIFQGRIRAGQHLVTQDLAERFGVSHTPIREALISLSGIGLITLAPNRGAIVKNVAAREVREVCQVRKALECEAVRSACGRIELDELETLADELRKLEKSSVRNPARGVSKARDLDSRLHDLIARSARNAFLAHELNRLKLLFRAFRDVAWEHDGAQNDYGRLAEEVTEHLAIVTALLTKDRTAATHAMSRHIRSGMTYWTRALPAVATATERVRPKEDRR